MVEIAGSDELSAAQRCLADAAAELAVDRHGVAAKTFVWCTDGNGAAQLACIASELGADLIVAGVYGHSLLHEWALGGITRNLLQHASRCILFSH